MIEKDDEIFDENGTKQMPIQWRHQYDFERDKIEGDRTIVHNKPDPKDAYPEGALQAPAADMDLNVLMERMGVTNSRIPEVPIDPNLTMDLRGVPDLQGILDLSRAAEKSFDQLPIALKQRFGNNPAQLWEFVNNPDNWQEAVKLGILKEETPPAPPPETKKE